MQLHLQNWTEDDEPQEGYGLAAPCYVRVDNEMEIPESWLVPTCGNDDLPMEFTENSWFLIKSLRAGKPSRKQNGEKVREMNKKALEVAKAIEVEKS